MPKKFSKILHSLDKLDFNEIKKLQITEPIDKQFIHNNNQIIHSQFKDERKRIFGKYTKMFSVKKNDILSPNFEIPTSNTTESMFIKDLNGKESKKVVPIYYGTFAPKRNAIVEKRNEKYYAYVSNCIIMFCSEDSNKAIFENITNIKIIPPYLIKNKKLSHQKILIRAGFEKIKAIVDPDGKEYHVCKKIKILKPSFNNKLAEGEIIE
jgi:hypothetical protein